MSYESRDLTAPSYKSGVEKQVTVLLSDIRGFTDIVESYPAASVFDMLNRYFERMGEIVSEYGGVIDKLMGDAILVVFGLPNEAPTDAECAVACATEMQLAMNDFNVQNRILGMPDLYVGIAINSGRVIAGQLGSKHYSEYTIIGDVMNLVSRIEAHCLRGQILLSETTYRLTRQHVTVGEKKSIEVKGGHEVLNVLELYATSKPRTLQVPRRERRRSPRARTKKHITVQSLLGKIVSPVVLDAQLVDFSYEGLCFDAMEQIPDVSEVKLSMRLDPMNDLLTEAYARIVNVDARDNGYRYGLDITSLDVAAQQAIKQYVDELLSSK